MSARTRRAVTSMATFTACATAVGVILPTAATAASAAPFISEIHYDNAGTDAGEAIEVTAALGTDLTGWSVVLYNGSGGAAYSTVVLAGAVDSPAGDPSGDGVVVVDYPANGVQNGSPDGVALVDATGAVVEFLSYEGVFAATDGAALGVTSTDIGVAEASTTPIGESLQRVDGTWTGPLAETFGAVNGSGVVEPPDGDQCTVATTATVAQIQGSGSSSPLAGTDVVVRGVVVADTQAGLSGFFIQDAGDGDPSTSDGVFVFAPGAVDVEVGDAVAVAGGVLEFFGLTEVSAGDVDVCGTAAVPDPAVLPFPSTDDEREPFEGMLVTPSEPLSVTGLFQLEDFGEVRLSSGGVLLQGTEAAAPGAPAAAVEAENLTREIVLDDGSTTNLSSAGIAPPYLTVESSVRIGDVPTLGSYVLSYGFSRWRLQPATGVADQAAFPDSRTAEPQDVGGDVRIAAFNVLNYFTTLDDGTYTDPEPRGAQSAEQLVQQQDKIVAAINALGADVVALQEIEYGSAFGQSPDVALAGLVAALNADLVAGGGAAVWAYIPTPTYYLAEPDVIQTGIIHRSDTVVPVGGSLSLGSDPTWVTAREPVAQRFSFDGDEFWVVSNHFKSKSASGSPTGDNLDSGDGQGAYNGDRVRQAEALSAAVADLVTDSGESDVFLMGDFNSYGMEDPIGVLTAAGYADVVTGADGFTYRFNWRSGNLDHAMLSASAEAKMTGVTIWQVNAAEPFAYQYDGDPDLYAPYAYRASDHNPIVVGFDADEPLGTDVALADLLDDGDVVDRDGSDLDLLDLAVAQVLERNPGSPVAVLTDPTAPVTAFLPDDAAIITMLERLLPGRVRNEVSAAIRLRLIGTHAVEQILLTHVVPGQTLTAEDLTGLAGTDLVTAHGAAVGVTVEAGTVVLVDPATQFADPAVTGPDVNAGQVQIGHVVDAVLLPTDIRPWQPGRWWWTLIH